MSTEHTHRSCAQWPEGTLIGHSTNDQITTDKHYSEREAEGVCRLLRREGFGGEGKIFPIKTWTEPINTSSS